ncbi:MAG: cation diffusion facilitator family transporter [Bacilli bacterium]|nr:cation diffusion facilitator family transporter [Bacilli bacterium]
MVENDVMNLDELESQLESQLDLQMSDLGELQKDFEKIGNPDSLGEVIKDVVWEQFINQVGVVAGEEFIKENRDLKLDLSDDAHIQTIENFEQGKIATHNQKIEYKKRYDDWHSNFQHDDNGNIITHQTRTGKDEYTLIKGARAPYDKGRPEGSIERGTDMDHVVSAGEIIRDSAANAHLTKEERISFANSNVNLNEMDASQNRSKGDNSMTDWLDNPNSNGQKPNEIFDIGDDLDKQYREKDKEARKVYKEVKREGEKRSIEAGKQSQKEEAFRMGGKALQAALMVLLADLIKKVIQQLVSWFRSAKKSVSTLLDNLKQAIHNFVSDLKKNLISAGDSMLTSIATAIFGPIVGVIKKVWILLKQGWRSLKEAINYIKDPANRGKSFGILMLEVGKIVIAGLTAAGAIVLGEVIEKGLLSFPVFAIQIPFLGSLASICGLFFGALVSGIIGAIALNLIDKAVAKKRKIENVKQQVEAANKVLATQEVLIEVSKEQVNRTKENVSSLINERHAKAADFFREVVSKSTENKNEIDELRKDIQESQLFTSDDLSFEVSAEMKQTSTKINNDLDDIFKTLDNI